ncbi:UDP-N-acetylglucosamine 2-epimerase [Alkalimarinus sediminis]|uniref:UDP-N-acetylglucosamine 2-epimerase n=1 Tax=Alkalimarinus sediminis TaxID=1632866 RepID=A0A9E8KI04_9ALTE|nr:UDP-N-acetylglucosamine 2-epimerase [Alkalimarinus sediminis]UZW73431.1 UDP-N-acetylglucosamine 2-epimerase [Alkalimarinus sediminis]
MRKIAIFTGTRAEYGLLYWIIKELHETERAELQLFVGGMHLSPEFGYTVSQIEKDGFPIVEKMEFLLSSDSPVSICKSMALALMSAGEALERHQPDLLVVLGDRFESMAVAQAGMITQTPIAHLHGGETTEGLIDEAVRHSITKMSHLHFTATEEYRNRVIQLGEQPTRVFNVGAPGIDSIIRLPLLEKEELSAAIGFQLDRPYLLVTYHPVTLAKDGASKSLENLLEVLDKYQDYKILISYPNADTFGRHLIDLLEQYSLRDTSRVFIFQSLGQLRYLSLMKHCTAVIGNSSSGLIEAPTFCVPTLNIGNRQKGRIAGETVVQCDDSKTSIERGLKKVVGSDFRNFCKSTKNPYGEGTSSEKIVELLLSESLDGVLEKSFNNLVLNK